MKNFIILFFFSLYLILLTEEISYANVNYYHNHYPHYYNKNNTLPENNLQALEKYVFNRAFSKDNEINRLERLEEMTFGSVQSGDIQTRYKNIESAILSQPQNNYKQTWRNNINNFLIGQPTGITPNVSPFFSQNYTPSYSNSRIEQLNNSMFGNRFRIHTNEYGSGSSIRVLD